MTTRARAAVAALTVLAVLVWGCAGAVREETVRVAPHTALAARQANFSEDDLRRIAQNCPFGRPRVDPSAGIGPTRFVIREGYVLEHSSRDKIPVWVCEGIDPAQLAGSLTRADAFAPDPLLPAGERAELVDYRGSHFDRGHMAPAGDQTRDAARKRETFYLSNMSPQVPQLNQQSWAALEALARAWLTARGGGYVITGGLFYDPKEDSVGTATGLITVKTIGPDKVAVPTHFYKIVVAKNAAGEWEAIAFVMQNRAYPRPFDFSKYIVSVAWIQNHTGIDFMPDLDVATELRVESTPSPMWPQ